MRQRSEQTIHARACMAQQQQVQLGGCDADVDWMLSIDECKSIDVVCDSDGSRTNGCRCGQWRPTLLYTDMQGKRQRQPVARILPVILAG